MKRIGATLLSLLSPIVLFAQESEQTIDDSINGFMAPITDVLARIVFASFSFNIGGEDIGIPFVLVWLVAGAIFFTVYFKFVNNFSTICHMEITNRITHEDHTCSMFYILEIV